MQQVGRDAEEPGAGVRPRKVVAGTGVEGDEEGLGRELVGEIAADATLEIGVDGVEMAVEDIARTEEIGSRQPPRRRSEIVARGDNFSTLGRVITREAYRPVSISPTEQGDELAKLLVFMAGFQKAPDGGSSVAQRFLAR